MAQKKALSYAQAKGAPAGFVLQSLLVIAASVARMIYTVSNSAATKHFLNSETGLVRIRAVSNGIYVALSGDASKTVDRAEGTLTSDTTEVADGTEVVVGSQTYILKDTPAAAYDVQIDVADPDITLGNLAAAINGTGTPGTEYFAGTEAHPDVVSSAVAANAITITAKLPGEAGNSIALTSDDAHLDASAATLTGGADGNFDEYVAAGATLDIALDESVDEISLIADAGSATAVVVEY